MPAQLYGAYAAMQGKRLFVSGAYSPSVNSMQTVYVYDIDTDFWKQLPLSDHYGVPHIIGGRLALIGGRLSSTKNVTNKVSTFDETCQKWTPYYPDLLYARYRPGVVTHLEHIFVAGGKGTTEMLDDIEVLDWTENIQWKRVGFRLPRPMFSFNPIIYGERFIIIGDWIESMTIDNSVFQASVSDIIESISETERKNAKPYTWTQLTSVVQYRVAPVLSCCQPVVLGGYQEELSTSDIKIYDYSDHTWKVIGSLSFARCAASAVAVNDNAIIVIGGCVRGHSRPAAMSTSLKTVELGRAEFIRPSVIPF